MVENKYQLSQKLRLRHSEVLLNSRITDCKQLYNHHDKIQAIKALGNADTIFDNKKVRIHILRALTSGVVDATNQFSRELGLDNLLRKCLHPREILHILNSTFDHSFKLPNLYFHLDILKNQGLITKVVQLTDGRYDLNYYGRTAKLFIFRTSNNEFDQVLLQKDELIRNLVKFSEIMGGKKKETEIRHMIDEFLDTRQNYESTIMQLLEKHGEKLYQEGIDINPIFVFLTHIYTTPNVRNFVQSISENDMME